MQRKHDPSIFCQNVKWLRSQSGLTQAEMAKILGISIYTLRKLEHGVLPNRLNCDILYQIHFVFGVSIDALLSEKFEDSPGAGAPKPSPGMRIKV